jgi:type VI secretion system secreted protein VgrG
MGTRTAGDASSAYIQGSRPMSIDTILEPDKLVLVGIDGEEAISQPFHYTLHLTSADPAIDAAQLVRSKATLRLESVGEPRLVHGRIATFVQLESDGELTSYRAELVPPVWFLSLARDSRVFVDKTVKDIVTTIFEEAGLAHGQDYEITLLREPPKLRWSACTK